MCGMILMIACLAGLGAPAAARPSFQGQEQPPKREKPSPEVTAREKPAADGLSREGAVDSPDEDDIPGVRDWRHMSARERRTFETFIERNFSEVWHELQPLRDRDSRAYNKRMEMLTTELMPIVEEQAQNAERADILIREKQLEFHIHELVAEYLLSRNEASRTKCRAQLVEMVGKLFDVVEERRLLDIRRLEERLAVLKKRVEENSRDRELIIARQVELHLNPTAGAEAPTRTKPSGKAENAPAEKSP